MAGLALILVLGALMGVALGPVKLDIHQVLSAIVSGDDRMAHVLVWDLRLPRVAAALLVGACLGLAGCLLQSSTRNPLGDPQLFGLGGGAAVVQASGDGGLDSNRNVGFVLSVRSCVPDRCRRCLGVRFTAGNLSRAPGPDRCLHLSPGCRRRHRDSGRGQDLQYAVR